MTTKVSAEEYETLEAYVSTVLSLHRKGEFEATWALSALMHPLTALIDGNPQEFIPYMRLKLEQWAKDED
ncbi:hypothetical protein [Aureimonas leprariae]|uniref:Uncharacterized protein n=1 Tax=Plantimonas leprariae TaxID=2615207 RepID=A0A7V7PL26_9HYPH|nr:hypothetical protein [Aureimonas leprariae]KAB0676722.1 hypothetical protein F6X38_20700 [Aureimonas leprariae]